MDPAAEAQRVLAARSHYEALGLSAAATDAELRKAFRALSLQLHPDKTAGAPAPTTAAFVRVAEAYEVLSSAEARRRYDAHLAAAEAAPRGAPRPAEAAGPGWRGAWDGEGGGASGGEMELREARQELASLRATLQRERRLEKEREARRQEELAEARQAGAHARRERDATKQIWGEKVAEERAGRDRQQALFDRKVASLHVELERERSATLMAKNEAPPFAHPSGPQAGSTADALPSAVSMAHHTTPSALVHPLQPHCSPHTPTSLAQAALLSDALRILMLHGAVSRFLCLSPASAHAFEAAVARPAAQAVRPLLERHEAEYQENPPSPSFHLPASCTPPRHAHCTPRPQATFQQEVERIVQQRVAASRRAPSASELRHAAQEAAAAGAALLRTPFGVEAVENGHFRVVQRDEHGWAAAPASSNAYCCEAQGRSSHSLRALLSQLDLERYCSVLEDEEIYDIDCLRSMGADMLQCNMRELGWDDASISRLSRTLFPEH
ncbi:hypothetical protein AB1Y20_013858 [Prymnesium parvum]|uniref:J domain-containing protein n=1 Tax=Prymnesium parvum TaxID=97485 RepID=A0AB34IH82_PRYPA